MIVSCVYWYNPDFPHLPERSTLGDLCEQSCLLFLQSMTHGTAGILQLCNIARHNVVIIYVPIYHAIY